jgi:diamine N-acetyltransferase
MFKSENLFLRAVESSDATALFLWENDTNHWRIANTEVPFSMHAIHNLIEQYASIRTSGQLRLMICLNDTNKAIGAVDLYDVNFKHGFATVGVLIANKEDRMLGFATQALNILIDYSENVLDLVNLQCFIHADNEPSIRLFEGLGFEKVGIRKGWYRIKSNRMDELCYQLCLKKEN